MHITREQLLALSDETFLDLCDACDPELANDVLLYFAGDLPASYIDIPDDMIPQNIYFQFVDDSGNSSKYINDE